MRPCCSRLCGSLYGRIRDALKTQLRVLVATVLICAIWLVIYFAAFSSSTRERFKEAVAPLNTDSGVWVGALIQAVFSVLTPFVLGTDDDLPDGCGCSRIGTQQESALELPDLEARLDDEDVASTVPKTGTEKIKLPPGDQRPSRTSVGLFLLWKTATFTIILAILTYYVRWFYTFQDSYFGAVHDEETGELKWDVLLKKILVDEYIFTPTNIPPVVTLFLFTRLVGRQLFLELDREGGNNADERVGQAQEGRCEEEKKTDVHSSDLVPTNGKAEDTEETFTCCSVALSWVVWVIPHYVLCLLTWFPR
jgi:hypothetical protein